MMHLHTPSNRQGTRLGRDAAVRLDLMRHSCGTCTRFGIWMLKQPLTVGFTHVTQCNIPYHSTPQHQTDKVANHMDYQNGWKGREVGEAILDEGVARRHCDIDACERQTSPGEEVGKSPVALVDSQCRIAMAKRKEGLSNCLDNQNDRHNRGARQKVLQHKDQMGSPLVAANVVHPTQIFSICQLTH